MCVCVTFVVFTDCDSCTRPISTNPGSIDTGEYGLTLGTCVIARRLEAVVVAGLLRLSWCVLGGVGFFVFFFSTFVFLPTRTASCKYEATSCLICISTSISQAYGYGFAKDIDRSVAPLGCRCSTSVNRTILQIKTVSLSYNHSAHEDCCCYCASSWRGKSPEHGTEY